MKSLPGPENQRWWGCPLIPKLRGNLPLSNTWSQSALAAESKGQFSLLVDQFASVEKHYWFLSNFQKGFDEDLKGELIMKMLIIVVDFMLKLLGDQR